MFTQLKRVLDNYISTCQTTTYRDGFAIKGKLVHWFVLLAPYGWLVYCLSLLFEGSFFCWLLIGLGSFLFAIFSMMSFTYEINISRKETIIRLKCVGVSYKVIRSKTKQLIIVHKDAEDLSLILKTKNKYAPNHTKNLRFDMDADEIFHINYQGKELDFPLGNDKVLWTQLMKALHDLDKPFNKRQKSFHN